MAPRTTRRAARGEPLVEVTRLERATCCWQSRRRNRPAIGSGQGVQHIQRTGDAAVATMVQLRLLHGHPKTKKRGLPPRRERAQPTSWSGWATPAPGQPCATSTPETTGSVASPQPWTTASLSAQRHPHFTSSTGRADGSAAGQAEREPTMGRPRGSGATGSAPRLQRGGCGFESRLLHSETQHLHRD